MDFKSPDLSVPALAKRENNFLRWTLLCKDGVPIRLSVHKISGKYLAYV